MCYVTTKRDNLAHPTTLPPTTAIPSSPRKQKGRRSSHYTTTIIPHVYSSLSLSFTRWQQQRLRPPRSGWRLRGGKWKKAAGRAGRSPETRVWGHKGAARLLIDLARSFLFKTSADGERRRPLRARRPTQPKQPKPTYPPVRAGRPESPAAARASRPPGGPRPRERA